MTTADRQRAGSSLQRKLDLPLAAWPAVAAVVLGVTVTALAFHGVRLIAPEWVAWVTFLGGCLISTLAATAMLAGRAGGVAGQLGQFEHAEILDSIVESAPVGLLTVDMEGNILLSSRVATEILGHDMTGRPAEECRAALDLRLDEAGTACPPDQTPVAQALRGEPVHDTELYLPEKNGRAARWIMCRASSIRDTHGAIRGAVIAFADITRRKRIEVALQEQTESQQRQVDRQSALAEVELAINEPHEILPLLDRLVELCERLLPAARASLVLCDEEIRRIVDEAAGPNATTPRAVAEIIARDGGATQWIVEHRHPLTVSRLEDDPFRTRPAVEGVRLGAYAGVPVLADGRMLGVLYALDEDAREYTQVDVEFLKVLASRAAAAVTKVRTYQELRSLNESLKDRAAELRENEKRFRTLADTAPVLIWMSTADKQRTWFNRTWLDFTGGTMEQESGTGWTRNVHPDDLEQCLSIYESAFDARNRFNMEYRLRRFNGEYKWVLDIGIPRSDENGVFLGYMGTCVDITLRKEAQIELEAQVAEQISKLRVADRLASIGTLTAGLGHDMSNVLFPVRCRLDALDHSTLPADLEELLRSVTQAVEYLHELSRGLRLCALDVDNPDASSGATNFTEWWTQVSPLMIHGVGHRTQLDVSLPEDLPDVRLAPHRLTQAVLNLVVNAAEAMPDGGTIRIEAAVNAEEELVELSVRDDGVGMTPEVKAQVLNPFFTTKTRSLSTGLGLSLVRGVVLSCGGTIDIDTAPGRGTTITLGLPAVPAGNGRVTDDASGAPAVISLEDPRTAAWVAGLLRSAGYEPQVAASPDGARLWITDPAPNRIDAARAYLAGDERRHVIVIGSDGEGWETTGAHVVNDVGRLDEIRAAIVNVTGLARGRHS